MHTGTSAIRAQQSYQINTPRVEVQGPRAFVEPRINGGSALHPGTQYYRNAYLNAGESWMHVLAPGSGNVIHYMAIGYSSILSGKTVTASGTTYIGASCIVAQAGDIVSGSASMAYYWAGNSSTTGYFEVHRRSMDHDNFSLISSTITASGSAPGSSSKDIVNISVLSRESIYIFANISHFGGTTGYRTYVSRNFGGFSPVGSFYNWESVFLTDSPFWLKTIKVGNDFYNVFIGYTQKVVSGVINYTIPVEDQKFPIMQYGLLEKLSLEGDVIHPKQLLFNHKLTYMPDSSGGNREHNISHYYSGANDMNKITIEDLPRDFNKSELRTSLYHIEFNSSEPIWRKSSSLSRRGFSTVSVGFDYPNRKIFDITGRSVNIYAELRGSQVDFIPGITPYFEFSYYKGYTPLDIITYANSNNNDFNLTVSNTDTENQVGVSVAGSSGMLLIENGDFRLLESGDNLVLG